MLNAGGGGSGLFKGYAYRTEMFEQDDFVGGLATSGNIGKLGWNAAGTFAVDNGVQDHPGILNMATGAVQGTITRINLFGSIVFLMSQLHGNVWIAKLSQVDAFTDVRFGVTNGWTGNPASSGIYFERLGADTNWFCVCRSGGVQTGSRIDSGVAASTNWVNLEYQRGASSVVFFINGTQVASISTNVPTIGGAFGCHIVNGEAQSKIMLIDFTQFYIRGLVR